MNKNNGTSKLASLRQKKLSTSTKESSLDIEKAVEGYAASIDTNTMLSEIEKSSAHVNFIIDCSGSMDGTSNVIASEMNLFTERQAAKIYSTMLSLTLFDDEVYPKFNKVNARDFVPISPWNCPGGTNIYDAIYTALRNTSTADANHRLHIIITDGQNGMSCYSLSEVQELVSQYTRKGDHIFLLYYDENGYNQSSAQNYASKLGIKPNNAANFDRKGDGIRIIFQTIEDLLDGLRSTGTIPEDWSKYISAHASNPEIKARDIKYLE